MKTHCCIPILTVVVAFSFGCRTNDARRAQAASLGERVAEHRQAQAARVDALNADYARTFARLVSELSQLNVDQLDSVVDLEAWRLSDDLVSDWGRGSLRARLRDAIAATLTRNRQIVALGEEAVAAAREAYAKSYAAAELEVKRLQQVESRLKLLSREDDDAAVAVDFVFTVARIYNEVREKAEQPDSGSNGD